MATWFLNRALTNFRDAVNKKYPHRDEESDGTIGDEAHQETDSDHNPDPEPQPDAGSVDAWDMDKEVNGKGQPYEADVQELIKVFEQHESSSYWIYDRQIAKRSNNWRRDPYTGNNPHDKHVHFNTRESHENSNAPWELGDMEQTEKLINKTDNPDRTVGHVFADLANLRNWWVSVPGGATIGAPPAGSVGALMLAKAQEPASPPVEVDVEALAQDLAPLLSLLLAPQLQASAEAAVRKVLGTLDGVAPEEG